MKDIKCYEGYYQISDNGDVFSTKRNKYLKPTINSKGYKYVTLCKENYHKKFLIHRLVADAYIKKEDSNLIVNHIDGNKLNNHYSNLEWCTYSENNIHAIETKLRIKNVGKHHYKAKAIMCYTKDFIFVKTFDTGVEAVLKGYGANAGHINSCCHLNRKSHNNYIWRFKNV